MIAFKLRLLFGTIAFVMAIDGYLWQGVKRLLKNAPDAKKKRVKFIFWSVPLIFITGSLLYVLIPALEVNKLFRNYYMALLVITYFSKSIALPFLFIDDITRFFRWLLLKTGLLKPNLSVVTEEQAVPDNKISRSKFLTQAGLITAGVPFIMLTKGIVKGAYDYKLRNQTLLLPHLPERFDGLKIIQISDIHSGSFFDKDAVKLGIDMIMQQKADLIFFTGDMVNNVASEAVEYMDIFGHINAPMGVFSTLGNHDYGDYVTNWESPEAKKKNLDDLCTIHKDLGWRLMRNEHETLSVHGQKIGLIGVENWGDRGRFQRLGDIEKAQHGMEEVPVKLLLSHDPSHWDAVVRKNHPDIDVMFAGHTHGMQFGIEIGGFKWSPSQYMYKQWAGLYEEGKQKLYVNRGFGFIGYPGRVGILPEITLFTLKKA